MRNDDDRKLIAKLVSLLSDAKDAIEMSTEYLDRPLLTALSRVREAHKLASNAVEK